MSYNLISGMFGDFETWALDNEATDRVFRVWFLSELCENYRLCRFHTIINLPDGDIMLGLQLADEEMRNQDPSILFCRLSDISFCYDPKDETLLECEE